MSLKGILCEVLLGGSALLLFYSVKWPWHHVNYIPQIMFNNVF